LEDINKKYKGFVKILKEIGKSW